MNKLDNFKVTIVGGGLVGTLEACLLGNLGVKVDVYECRQDERKHGQTQGRSINMTLSARGLAALALLGIQDEITTKYCIPIKARLVHDTVGRKKVFPYGKNGQCLYSIQRKQLNEILLAKAENHPNVTLNFSHKLKEFDIPTGEAIFKMQNGSEKLVKTDLLLGCDGAHSTVRRIMIKQPHFNYSQKYISHGYVELSIPPNKAGQFAMEAEYLHIWPRRDFMLIALPNKNKTFTVTFFAPVHIFDSINRSDYLLEFFTKHFPDTISLIGRNNLVVNFFNTKPSPLISIKCSPYHVKERVVILGDAAHAMVPFYGQGVNAGFEDCLILNKYLGDPCLSLEDALKSYSSFRDVDAGAICDLAMYNYTEMRELVNTSKFLMRKKIDNFLNLLLGENWVPLYSMVAFSSTRYHDCVKRRKRQDQIVAILLRLGIFTMLAVAFVIILRCVPSCYK